MIFKTLNKKFLLVILLISFFSGVFFVYNNKTTKSVNIDKVLSSAAYNYLPKEAKEYVKEAYKETGNIILTEKNKKKNESYLNPLYIEYLSKNKEDKNNFGLVPEKLVIDYVYNKETSSDVAIPKSYDLRNVNGKNFVTSIKDQGNLNICWAFATNAQIESYFLLKNNESASINSKRFSERQVDYATSKNGMKDYTNEYGFRNLGAAGNFIYEMFIGMNGLALSDKSWKLYDDTDYEQMNAHEVLNLANSNYEINSTINFPILPSESDEATRTNYLNTIKQNVVEYGGAYIGTGAPQYGCSYYDNASGKYIINVDGSCEVGAHAMQIIGWDDELEYSYCNISTKHYSSSDSICNDKDIITGKGVWLLKNSWGNIEPYSYVAYDSLYSIIYLANDVAIRNWDNYYDINIYDEYGHNYVTKKIIKKNNKEKLVKAKIVSLRQAGTYNIYIGKNNTTESLQLIGTLNTNLPGLYTIDLSNKDIILTDDEYYIKIQSTDNFILDSAIYTENVEDKPVVNTNDIYYEKKDSQTTNYIFNLYSATRNILSNSSVSYKLFDSNNNDVTEYLTYTNNVVAKNDINAVMNINKNIPLGIYTLQTIYENDVKSTSKVEIDYKNYTIKFNSNGGTDTMANQKLYIDQASKLSKNLFTKRGYSFIGWNTKSDGSGTTYTDEQQVINLAPAASSINLYAMWNVNTYTIEYDYDDGIASNLGDSIYTITTESTNLPLVTKRGYNFKKWEIISGLPEYVDKYIYPDSNNRISLLNCSENIRLKAIWEGKATEISLQSDADDYNHTRATNIVFGTDNLSPINILPTKTGYAFVGYYTIDNKKIIDNNGNLVLDNIYMNNSKWDNEISRLTLYAKFVEFNMNLNKYLSFVNYIRDVTKDTNIIDFKNNIEINSNLNLEIYKDNEKITDEESLIGTGAVAKIFYNDDLIKEYIVVVKGDINGDGKANIGDLSKLYNFYRKNITFEYIYSDAADITGNGLVDIADLSKFYNFYRGNISSF